jgi:hypothetical protein
MKFENCQTKWVARASTVDKINVLLQKTGFRGFQLRPHARVPDKYEVVREDGEVAKGHKRR